MSNWLLICWSIYLHLNWTKLIWIQLYKLAPWLLLQTGQGKLHWQKPPTTKRNTQSHIYFSKGQWALGSGAPEIERMVKSGLHTSSGRGDLVHFEYFKTETKTETYISIFSFQHNNFDEFHWKHFCQHNLNSHWSLRIYTSLSLISVLFFKIYSTLTHKIKKRQIKWSVVLSLNIVVWITGTPGNLWNNVKKC